MPDNQSGRVRDHWPDPVEFHAAAELAILLRSAGVPMSISTMFMEAYSEDDSEACVFVTVALGDDKMTAIPWPDGKINVTFFSLPSADQGPFFNPSGLYPDPESAFEAISKAVECHKPLSVRRRAKAKLPLPD